MLVRNADSLSAGSTMRGSSLISTSSPVFLSLCETDVSNGLGLNETAFWSSPRESQWARSCSGV